MEIILWIAWAIIFWSIGFFTHRRWYKKYGCPNAGYLELIPDEDTWKAHVRIETSKVTNDTSEIRLDVKQPRK
jgi:hypothetical protein